MARTGSFPCWRTWAIPRGTKSLRPMMDQTFEEWLSEFHLRNYVRMINGRVRRCASQEGNAIWSSLRLGFADERTTELVERLIKWQWPDGGWNCDKHPEAINSSFMESLIPLRALALYANTTGERRVWLVAERAADIFLKRELFRRQGKKTVMDTHFVKLHYPCYWHYDILFGLKVMAEAGFIGDPRCKSALDLLESKRLPDGGFPAEETYSRLTRPELSNYSPVNWGGISTRRHESVRHRRCAVRPARGGCVQQVHSSYSLCALREPLAPTHMRGCGRACESPPWQLEGCFPLRYNQRTFRRLAMTEPKPLNWSPTPGIGYTVVRRADGGMQLTFTDLSEATLKHWHDFSLEHLFDSDRLTRNLYDLRQVKSSPRKGDPSRHRSGQRPLHPQHPRGSGGGQSGDQGCHHEGRCGS